MTRSFRWVAIACCLAAASCTTNGRAAEGSHPDAPATSASAATGQTSPETNQVVSRATTTIAPTRETTTTQITPENLSIAHGPLTTEDWKSYDYRTGPTSVTITAPDDLVDSSMREVFWPSDAAWTRDGEACVTWDTSFDTGGANPLQPGLAMRIRSTGDRNHALRAITVTENVWSHGVWLFNVHVWDTLDEQPKTLLHTWNLADVVAPGARPGRGAMPTFVEPPWHLCGRTWGNVFSFKVWDDARPEPEWDDAKHVFSTQLPAGWDDAGYSGGYIGHLHSGQQATAVLEDRTSPN